MTLSQFIQSTPPRGRVSLALAIGDKVLNKLIPSSTAYNVARAGLEDGWKWSEGQNIEAAILNNRTDAVVDLEMNARIPAERSALTAIGTALAYLTWEAFGEDLEAGRISESSIPSQMSDVDETWVIRTFELAQQILGDEIENFVPTITSKITDYLARHGNKPGTTISIHLLTGGK